ncbi:putative Carbohydrate Esterase Family 3 [Paramyrothecium foliicola]|nr:putative Carbohydrate Esterase Family 3 [Paramyrothecium foliicola]
MRLPSSFIIASLLAIASAQTVKVLLLGDSITEISCWRTLVWNQITSAGLAGSVDLVGTMNNLQSKCTRPSGFDSNHEGHSGWQAYDIARNNIVGWVQNTEPDVVQFMLGTNDLLLGQRTVQTILDSYTTIVNAIRAANPRAKIIVDKLIPASFNDASIDSLNNAIPGWVQQRSTTESPIIVADCSKAAGFTLAMLEDGIHPNSQGDQLIASQIGPKLVQFIKDVRNGGSNLPAPTTATTTLVSSTSIVPQPTDVVCASLYGQCGGSGWAGPKCCSQGACKVSNQWYSQCL